MVQVKLLGLEKLNEEITSDIKEFLQYPSWERYVQENVQEKNDGIITYLKNHGFMLAKYDSTVVKIDTLNSKTDITTFFNTGRWYTYGDIKIEKEGESSSQISYELISYVSNINIGDAVQRRGDFKKQGKTCANWFVQHN